MVLASRVGFVNQYRLVKDHKDQRSTHGEIRGEQEYLRGAALRAHRRDLHASLVNLNTQILIIIK